MPGSPTNVPQPTDGLRRELVTRWPLPEHPEVRDALLKFWGAPARGYHDLLHLLEVLERLEELADAVPHDRTAVNLAAWFHDAVYDGSPSPEARSAQWAREALDGVADVDADEVARLVLLTEDHTPVPDDTNGVALCDADLAILAAPPQRYASYARGVRHEYAHLDDETFNRGRAAVLREFVRRPHLFTSAEARRRWEPRARANASAEISTLDTHISDHEPQAQDPPT